MLANDDHFVTKIQNDFRVGIDLSFTSVLDSYDVDVIAIAQVGLDQVLPARLGGTVILIRLMVSDNSI